VRGIKGVVYLSECCTIVYLCLYDHSSAYYLEHLSITILVAVLGSAPDHLRCQYDLALPDDLCQRAARSIAHRGRQLDDYQRSYDLGGIIHRWTHHRSRWSQIGHGYQSGSHRSFLPIDDPG